jgi:hypothetical protein
MQRSTRPFVNLRKFMSPRRRAVAKLPAVPVANPVEQHKQAEVAAKAATTKAMALEDIAEKHTLEKKKTKLVAELAKHTQEHHQAKAAHSQLEIQLESARKKDDSIDHSKLQDAVNVAEKKVKDIKDEKNEKKTTLKSLQAGGRRRRRKTRRKRRKSRHRRLKRHTKKRRRSPKKRRRKRHTKKRSRSRRR